MTTINVYLTFDGDCEAAFNFYSAVFQKKITEFNRFEEMPPQEGMPPLPEAHKKRVMHASIPFSKEIILMGSDTGGEWAQGFKAGNNFSISITTDSKEEADRLFQELSAGGQVTMPMDNTFWGSYFGSLTDKFGINWMVSFDTGSGQ